MGMSFDRDELIAAVIQRITVMEGLGMDPLDTIEILVDLETEFGTGVVQQAIYLLEKKKKRSRSQPTGGESDPLWDRELDG
jgi:hypothetical protein